MADLHVISLKRLTSKIRRQNLMYLSRYVREVRFDVAVSSGAPNRESCRPGGSRHRSRSRREPANISSAFRSTSQHIAPNTSPVSLDAPILRRGSRLRERATMPNGANLRYTCVNDLVKQTRVNCGGKKPRSVYQRLPTMR
ncbi:uncharacterized protein LOC105281106 isoform X2 [Ooceraea biroi]|uniref:uncharacterized protein LOC105281106 isoform X2 n=1 Tax=Ooceraea biroi TaxID=2015173 RepID=UPI000F083EDC|nr:uncharacterized protein LOC105281106 isoform X2 [Ooceraea biroi]